MKWLIYGAGLLVSAALLTALRTFGLYPATSPLGAGAVTVVIFFFGVYFFPRLIIRRIEAKRAAVSVDVSAAVDVPAPVIVDTPAPEETPEEVTAEPKRKPIRRDVAGYQLAVFVLVVLLVLSALNNGSLRSDIEELQLQNEEQYHDRYEEGYSAAEDIAYENGYTAGCDDAYSTGYEEGRQYGFKQGYNIYYDEIVFFSNNACIVTEEGYRYHHFGCSHIEGRTFWIYNKELAEIKGYTPCLDCWDNGIFVLPFPLE